MGLTLPIKFSELSPEFKNQYLVKVQGGKEHMTVQGAMVLAQEYGIKSLNTELLQAPNANNGQMAIIKATIVDKDDNTWTGIGDCDNTSVNKMIAPHKVRMAETRAIGRACRFMLGINTLSDEIYTPELINAHQVNDIKTLISEKSLSKEEANRIFTDITGKIGLANATKDEAALYIQTLRAQDAQ